jgi:hypothetical protein
MKKAIKIENIQEYYKLIDYDKEVCDIVGREQVIHHFPMLLVINDGAFRFVYTSFESNYLVEQYKSEGYKFIDAKIYLRKDKLSRIKL